MAILVLDASVIFDLERGRVLEATFQLEHVFVTPDLLFHAELAADPIGEQLRAFGMQIIPLEPAEVLAAQELAREHRALSSPDCWAMVCARRDGHRLVCGDARLRAKAEDDGVPCSGLLWMLDRLHESAILPPLRLADGLADVHKHRRARLPKEEVEERLARWRAEASRMTAREPTAAIPSDTAASG